MTSYTFDPSHHIGVLMGGLSPEREISLKSGKAVAKSLRDQGFQVSEIIVNRDIASVLQTANIDVAWVALHGVYGEDGCIQGLLEIMGIPYTSSGVQACAVSMHKTRTKQVLRNTTMCISKDQVWDSATPFPSDWQVPFVIKDPLGGSSIGVWICKSAEALQAAIQECQGLGGEYLIEEYVSGIEITVALLDGSPLPVITIIPHGDFFDLKAKYTKGETTYLAPDTVDEVISIESGIPKHIAQDAQEQAVIAFNELGMHGVCRADFIVPCEGRYPNVHFTSDTRPVFLEMNAIPGMTETSLTPMAASVTGVSFADLTRIITTRARLEN